MIWLPMKLRRHVRSCREESRVQPNIRKCEQACHSYEIFKVPKPEDIRVKDRRNGLVFVAETDDEIRLDASSPTTQPKVQECARNNIFTGRSVTEIRQ